METSQNHGMNNNNNIPSSSYIYPPPLYSIPVPSTAATTNNNLNPPTSNLQIPSYPPYLIPNPSAATTTAPVPISNYPIPSICWYPPFPSNTNNNIPPSSFPYGSYPPYLTAPPPSSFFLSKFGKVENSKWSTTLLILLFVFLIFCGLLWHYNPKIVQKQVVYTQNTDSIEQDLSLQQPDTTSISSTPQFGKIIFWGITFVIFVFIIIFSIRSYRKNIKMKQSLSTK